MTSAVALSAVDRTTSHTRAAPLGADAAATATAIMPTAWAIHAALTRPLLTLGIERPVAALEVTLCLALVLGVGMHVATLALVALIITVGHPVMLWVTARDPIATTVFIRSRRYADYYAPQAALHAPPRRPRVSIPPTR